LAAERRPFFQRKESTQRLWKYDLVGADSDSVLALFGEPRS
jgi:hypothetical protein